MEISTAIFCFGASVSAGWGGAKPCETVAAHLNMPLEIHARTLASIADLNLDPAKLRDAKLVLSIDGFHWLGQLQPHEERCEAGLRALDDLIATRAGKPMILGNVQHNYGCAKRINAALTEKCNDACKVVDLTGDLKPRELHPDADFMQRVMKRIYAPQSAEASP